MPKSRRQMALTAELVDNVARVVEDAGPSPGAVSCVRFHRKPNGYGSGVAPLILHQGGTLSWHP
jgi:hypothetical protein